MQDCKCYPVVNTFLLNCSFFRTCTIILYDFDQIRMINLMYIFNFLLLLIYQTNLQRNSLLICVQATLLSYSKGVVAPWCNPLTLQPEQLGGVGSTPGRTPPLECHDKGSRAR